MALDLAALSLPPSSWAVISAALWMLYGCLASAGLGAQQRAAITRAVVLGVGCSCTFLMFLAHDQEFHSWADVYFFCGSKMQYCTCSYRWNLNGWCKAFVLWSFVLSTALGLQRLCIHLGLCGLLPGEEVVARESFISICWRLVPYWLNNWEQQWGSECTSMTYELPQFAVELLIVLPCVQILSSRMKVLALPSVNAALPPGRDEVPQVVRREYVPNVLRGCWERQPDQANLLQRIRANKRIICFSFCLCLLAWVNALVIPLSLEDAVLTHHTTPAMQLVGRIPADGLSSQQHMDELRQHLAAGNLSLSTSFVLTDAANRAAGDAAASAYHYRRLLSQEAWGAPAEALGRALYPASAVNGTLHDKASAAMTAAMTAAKARVHAALASIEEGPWRHNSSWVDAAMAALLSRVSAYQQHGCSDMAVLAASHRKHHEEIFRMQDPEHRATIPLVEAALTLMRLSTEKFFVLLSLYVAFIVYRTPPRAAAALVALVARVSSTFARLILWSFPAVCWVYGAGILFSSFVSVVFWGGPLLQLFEFLRTSVSSATISCLRPATAAEIERMGGDCAICWGRMTQADASSNDSNDNSSRSAAKDSAAADEPPQLQLEQQSGASAAEGTAAAGAADLQGVSLPCNHAYHEHCLSQWLHQCHSQGVAAACPMCQHPMQLQVTWHFAFWRRRPGQGAARAAWAADVGAAAEGANNYLLEFQPRLAELLADMPIILAQENIQLLAEVQDLRHQRQQLVGELQLRNQQLQALAGRQQQLQRGLEMEQQRQQLQGELELLRRALGRQRQFRRLRAQAGAGQQPAAGDGPGAWDWPAAGLAQDQQQQQQFVDAFAGADWVEDRGERFRQLELLLDAFIQEQEQAASQLSTPAAAAASSRPGAATAAAAAGAQASSSSQAMAQQAKAGTQYSVAAASATTNPTCLGSADGPSCAASDSLQEQQQQPAMAGEAAAAVVAQQQRLRLRWRQR